QTYGARHRIFTGTNCSSCALGGAEKDPVDSQQLARPDPLRRDAAFSRADVLAGAGALERARHLRFRGRIWRNGPPPPGNDPRLRRSRSVRTVSLALHFCADFSTCCLRSLLLVGSERDRSRRFLLGCLAWDDADLRLLSNLRRKDRLLRHANASPRLRDLCRLVCDGGASFLATHGRHTRNLLRQWRSLRSALASAQRTANNFRRRHRDLRLVPVQL